jgi:hypothetical protein
VAEAAREWLDAQLPPDFNQTREEREAIEEEAAAAEAAGGWVGWSWSSTFMTLTC